MALNRFFYISKIVSNTLAQVPPSDSDLRIKGVFTSHIEPDSNIIEIPISMLSGVITSRNYAESVYHLLQRPINNDNKIISYIKVRDYSLCYKTFPSIEREIFIGSSRLSYLRGLIFKSKMYYTNFGNVYTEDFTPLIFNTVKLKASGFENIPEFVERSFHIHPKVFTEDDIMTRFIRNKYIKELLNIKTCSLLGVNSWIGNSMPITINIEDVKNKFMSFTNEPSTNKLDANILNADIQSYLNTVIDNVTPVLV